MPTATDIAFAVVVLAVVGRGLPPALRTFLLTLAVVDDLIAISVIALVYTDTIHIVPLLGGVASIAVFGLFATKGLRKWWLLIPIAVVAWALVHASGVHATVAGVALGLVVPARNVAGRWEHAIRPYSSALCVPIFAVLSAGIAVSSFGGAIDSLTTPVSLAIGAGLVIGKFVGVVGGTFLATRFPNVKLREPITWPDIFSIAPLTGIGFTVSLLVAELAFGPGTENDEHAKLAILVSSVIAALLGATAVAARARAHRRLSS